jgi:hypothetical protein
MTIFRNNGRWDQSNVEFDGRSILAYDKINRTPRMHHIDYGLGAFARRAFAGMAPGSVHDLATLYADLLAKNELAAWESPERFYEIGSAQGIQELSAALKKNS